MAVPVRFEASTGTLRCSPADIRDLVFGRVCSTLLKAGVADGRGVPHPSLRDTVEAIHDPCHGVARVICKGRAMDLWRGRHTTAVITPLTDEGSHTLVRVPTTSLTAAVLRAVNVGPRPLPRNAVLASSLVDQGRIVRWWWLLSKPAGERPGVLLEAVDTDGGLYVIVNDVAEPSDSLAIDRHVEAVFRESRPVAPLRPLPDTVELPTSPVVR